MTPSFNYQMPQSNKQLNFSSNNDMTFSPLSSPAILPQTDRHPKQSHFLKNDPSNSLLQKDHEQYENMSVNEICEQYEQLEQAKLLITQKLSQLQKTQHQYNNNQYQQNLLSPSNSRTLMKNGREVNNFFF